MVVIRVNESIEHPRCSMSSVLQSTHKCDFYSVFTVYNWPRGRQLLPCMMDSDSLVSFRVSHSRLVLFILWLFEGLFLNCTIYSNNQDQKALFRMVHSLSLSHTHTHTHTHSFSLTHSFIVIACQEWTGVFGGGGKASAKSAVRGIWVIL
jgi:hypothetical protein